VYCAGLGVPFLVAGLAFGTLTSSLAIVKRHYSLVIFAGGGILIFMGVLVFTGQFTQLNITVSDWLNSLGLPNLSGYT
jgi:cytochrome c-type biogenesis protein